MGYWSEIQNDYFSTDMDQKQGDMLATISIDAWHTGEDQGQVVANVLLSKHGDVLVDYHDYVAMHDDMAQKAIGEARDQLREYFQELRHSERGNPDVQQHISVETPIGEIYVGITHLDPDYPGIYVDIKGQNLNARFEKDSVSLAVIEFNPEKKNIQTLVWKNANQEDYTFAVEHENLVVAPSLSNHNRKQHLFDQIEKATWETACDLSIPHNVMSVQIGFSHKENAFDETEFSISSYDKKELGDLFEAFCEENSFENVSVNYLIIVRVAPTMEDLIEMESCSTKKTLDKQIQSASTRATECHSPDIVPGKAPDTER